MMLGRGKPSRSPRKSPPRDFGKRIRLAIPGSSPVHFLSSPDRDAQAVLDVASALASLGSPQSADSLGHVSTLREYDENGDGGGKMPARNNNDHHLLDDEDADDESYVDEPSDNSSNGSTNNNAEDADEDVAVDGEGHSTTGAAFYAPAPPPKGKKGKGKKGKSADDGNGRKSEAELWKLPYYRENVPKDELPFFFAEFGHKQFGGGGYLNWDYRQGKSGRENSDGIRIRKLRCAFHGYSGCGYVVKEIYNPVTETATIQLGTIEHNDHSAIIPTRGNRRGLSKLIVSKLFSSRTKIDSTLGELVSKAINDYNFTVDDKVEAQINNFLAGIRRRRYGTGHNPSSWGGLRAAFGMYYRANIPNFNENTPYCFGFKADPDNGNIVAVISTEDLLLNLYRAKFWGAPLLLCIDGSFRLTKEGFGVLPITTVNLAQQSKILCYGIISTENARDIGCILSWVKDEVKRIIFERKATNTPIYN